MKTIMEQEYSPFSDCVYVRDRFNGSVESNHLEEIVAYPQTHQGHLGKLSISSSQRIRLALEHLQCFELVEKQFSSWGITFVNAIALQPSNPAFGVQPNQTVLMGAPKSGWLEVHFQHPVRRVEALVTSSRRTILSGYDQEAHEIDRTEMKAKLSNRRLPLVLPHEHLCIEAENIYKVTFYTFDGQLIVDQFKVEF